MDQKQIQQSSHNKAIDLIDLFMFISVKLFFGFFGPIGVFVVKIHPLWVLPFYPQFFSVPGQERS